MKIQASSMACALVDAIKVQAEKEKKAGFLHESAYLRSLKDTLKAVQLGLPVEVSYE